MSATILHDERRSDHLDSQPLIVGFGGTARSGSTTEICLRHALDAARKAGARTEIFSADALDLPMYAPGETERGDRAAALVEAVRRCDGLILASPSYHGNVSGLLKNALDYLEDLRTDPRPYLEGRAVGCIACAAGWQGTVATLTSLRSIVHALRGWPTPLGVTINTADPVTANAHVVDVEVGDRLLVLGTQVLDFARGRRP